MAASSGNNAEETAVQRAALGAADERAPAATAMVTGSDASCDAEPFPEPAVDDEYAAGSSAESAAATSAGLGELTDSAATFRGLSEAGSALASSALTWDASGVGWLATASILSSALTSGAFTSSALTSNVFISEALTSSAFDSVVASSCGATCGGAADSVERASTGFTSYGFAVLVFSEPTPIDPLICAAAAARAAISSGVTSLGRPCASAPRSTLISSG